MNKTSTIGLLAGLALGIVAGYWPDSDAARNASGTYSLPSGNPVVTGTTITSTWANNTLSDLSTEMTSSLDRAGRGAMTAPLQCSSGSVSAPGLTFSGDTNTGLYRIAADNLGATVGGTQAQEWSVTESRFPLGVTVLQDTTNAAGLTVTGNGTAAGLSATGGATGNGLTGTAVGGSGSGVIGTGFDTGAGVIGLGGGTSGTGVSGLGGSTIGYGVSGTGGSPNGSGVRGVGTGNGNGVLATGGGSSASGTFSTGGTPNGTGVQGVGAGTGAGGLFTSGTAATGGTRQSAVTLTNGDLDMNGVANPTSTTALLNRITPASFIKAWASLTGTTVDRGMNVSSVTCASSLLTVTMAQGMNDGNYVVSCEGGTSRICSTSTETTGSFVISVFGNDGVLVDLCTGSPNVRFMLIGAQ